MILFRVGMNIFVASFNFLQKIFPHKRVGKKINNVLLRNCCYPKFMPDLW